MEPLISINEYQEACENSEAMDFEEIAGRFCGLEKIFGLHNTDQIRLFHGVLGLATESGEIADNVKKHLFYGKDADEPNLIEELGDILWYVANLLQCHRRSSGRSYVPKYREAQVTISGTVYRGRFLVSER